MCKTCADIAVLLRCHELVLGQMHHDAVAGDPLHHLSCNGGERQWPIVGCNSSVTLFEERRYICLAPSIRKPRLVQRSAVDVCERRGQDSRTFVQNQWMNCIVAKSFVRMSCLLISRSESVA